MSRPLRLEFPGAVYHLTSRGDRREPIYRDDEDRRQHLAVLAQEMDRFDACILAYCLMGNHHLVLQTRQPNLSRVMRHLNGVYTQLFNRRHGLVGHLFQGRFKAILVDTDNYLLTLCRYVERNPVAAGLVDQVSQWPWSSYAAHVGAAAAEDWLDVDAVYRMLLLREPRGPADRRRAAACYAELVADTAVASPWDEGLRQQIFLGDEAFVANVLARLPSTAARASDIPRPQRQLPASWAQFLSNAGQDCDAALHAAYTQGGLTMSHLATQAGLSVSRVSRIIATVESAPRHEMPS
jgi:putative transposase